MVEEPLQYPLAYPAYLCQPDGGRTGAGGHTDPDNLSGSADQQRRGKRLRTGGPDRGQYEIPRGGQWISFAEEPGKVYTMRAIFGTSGLRDEGVVIAEIDKAIFEDRFRPLEEKRQFGILSVEKRIRILYGEQYGISLSSGVGEGTVVLVRLRLYHRIVQGLTRGAMKEEKGTAGRFSIRDYPEREPACCFYLIPQLCGLFTFKQWCREISFRCIRQHGHDCFSGTEFFSQLQCSGYICAAGDAAEDAFLSGEVFRSLQRFLIGDDTDVIVDFPVQDCRDQSVPYPHLQVGADGTAGEDRRMFRLDSPNFHLGILGFQHFAYAGYGAAGADTGTEAVDGAGYLFEYFKGGMVPVCLCVVRILKLLGDIDFGIFPFHAQRCLEAFFDAGADIPRVVDKDHFRPVVVHQFATLFADRIRHDDDRAVSFHSSHEGKPDALIAAGRLHDDRIGFYLSFPFRFADHIVGRSCFYGAAHVQSLKFH